MRNTRILLLLTALLPLILPDLSGQKPGLNSITIPELNAHISFLASDELKGRETGEPGLQIAARYLATQAVLTGLKSLDEDGDYLQYYTIVKKEYDLDKSAVTITGRDGKTDRLKDEFFLFPRTDEKNIHLEGEVVFAGYGIHAEELGYDDFKDVDIRDKIVLIMTRSPMDEKGERYKLDDARWQSEENFQHKVAYIYSMGARAILRVYDPKSGIRSISDIDPQLSNYLRSSVELKEDMESRPENPDMMKIILIHRHIADKLLEGSGTYLPELQMKIDNDLTPRSFLIKDKKIQFDLHIAENEIAVPNVFAIIEGRDPVLKEEMVLYTAHMDHLGDADGGKAIFNGADDNASGSVALLEIAEAFMSGQSRPERSVGFLWISGSEYGLMGSDYYSRYPVHKLERTAAVINLDMIARSRTEADSAGHRHFNLTIVGKDSVQVIGGLQSSVLMDLNRQVLEEMNMTGIYTYNSPDHPDRTLYRSDHYSFMKRDIPSLFYSTGIHHDYQATDDVVENLDFETFLRMTRLSFLAGYRVANFRGPIKVDHPFSEWE